MHLENLTITLQKWGNDEGKYTGIADFGSDGGKAQIRINPEHCLAILKVCAEGIVNTAKEVSENLVAQTILVNSSNLLETAPVSASND